MRIALGVVLLLLSLLAWIAQLLTAVAPALGARWGLTEAETEVDSTFYADVRAECLWDALSLWTLPLGAVLLILGEPSWAIFGLFGGGMYVYFAGRGVFQRLVMRRRGISVGKDSTARAAYLFLGLWGAAGMAMAVLACYDLSGMLELWK